MRSYIVSLSVIASLLGLYTALVLTVKRAPPAPFPAATASMGTRSSASETP